MLHSVSPCLTTYHPGGSTCAPAVSQVREAAFSALLALRSALALALRAMHARRCCPALGVGGLVALGRASSAGAFLGSADFFGSVDSWAPQISSARQTSWVPPTFSSPPSGWAWALGDLGLRLRLLGLARLGCPPSLLGGAPRRPWLSALPAAWPRPPSWPAPRPSADAAPRHAGAPPRGHLGFGRLLGPLSLPVCRGLARLLGLGKFLRFLRLSSFAPLWRPPRPCVASATRLASAACLASSAALASAAFFASSARLASSIFLASASLRASSALRASSTRLASATRLASSAFFASSAALASASSSPRRPAWRPRPSWPRRACAPPRPSASSTRLASATRLPPRPSWHPPPPWLRRSFASSARLRRRLLGLGASSSLPRALGLLGCLGVRRLLRLFCLQRLLGLLDLGLALGRLAAARLRQPALLLRLDGVRRLGRLRAGWRARRYHRRGLLHRGRASRGPPRVSSRAGRLALLPQTSWRARSLGGAAPSASLRMISWKRSLDRVSQSEVPASSFGSAAPPPGRARLGLCRRRAGRRRRLRRGGAAPWLRRRTIDLYSWLERSSHSSAAAQGSCPAAGAGGPLTAALRPGARPSSPR